MNLQEAISHYGGADEAYEQKLKKTISGAMGYSNYVNKANAAAGRPLSLNLKGNITPEGVQSLVRGAIGMRETETEGYGKILTEIDTEAGSLASKLAAKNKASMKNQYDTTFIFQPENSLEGDILRFVQERPKNDDGSYKTLEQFEAELNENYGTGGVAQNFETGEEITSTGAKRYSSEDIRNTIVDKLPPDYIGNEINYKYRFKGMGKEQANDEMLHEYGDRIIAGEYVPPELYSLAYATLTDEEKSALQGYKKRQI